jgi:hypothetical protein
LTTLAVTHKAASRRLRSIGRRGLVGTGIQVEVRVRALQSAVATILPALAGELSSAASGGWFEGLRVVNVAVVNPESLKLNLILNLTLTRPLPELNLNRILT